jgi:hypothetical protein
VGIRPKRGTMANPLVLILNFIGFLEINRMFFIGHSEILDVHIQVHADLKILG